MGERLTIKAITPQTNDWTCKIQVVDKGHPRDNKDRTIKYQLMTFEDEEGSQVQAIMFNSDITHFGDLFEPFHTYLVSVAQVKESSYAYGDLVNKFTWKIDLSTIVGPIEEVNPPEAPLPPPTRLSVTSFDAFEHIKVKESEFDVLAIVVNGEPPKYAANGKQIQEFIIMDNQKKPSKITLWEDFVENDGNKLYKLLGEYPIILAKRITKSSSDLSTRYNTTIHINPPYPQVKAMREWSNKVKQMLNQYTLRSTSVSGSLTIVPFEEEILSISEIQMQPLGKVFYVEGEISVVNVKQRFCTLSCSQCKLQLTRTSIQREVFCTICKARFPLIPRCQFEITVTDKTGSATAIIADDPAHKLLRLTLEEIFEICCVKKELLPFENVQKHLSGKTFKIQLKKSFSKGADPMAGKLFVVTYTEKENATHLLLTSSIMDTSEGSKRKFGDVTSREIEFQNPTIKSNPSSSKDKIEKKGPLNKH